MSGRQGELIATALHRDMDTDMNVALTNPDNPRFKEITDRIRPMRGERLKI